MLNSDTDSHVNGGTAAGRLLGAFLVGAAAGAIAGTLFAPAPGNETREGLRRRMTDGKTRARDAFTKGRATVEREAGRVRETVRTGRSFLSRFSPATTGQGPEPDAPTAAPAINARGDARVDAEPLAG